jgi:hypothetical protein
MAERFPQQQPVISIRISEDLRERLEKLKQMMALKTGESVSTSEAAKQLLESARDDRIEVVGLLLQPTESLLRVRKKVEARLTLSQAEWTLVAYYCTQGAESFASTEQGQLSHESLAEILEAFLAAHAVARRPSRVAVDWVYLQTLPMEKTDEVKEPADVTKEDVRKIVNRTIRMLRNAAQKRRRPILAVRNLYTMLDDEKFSNIEKLNDALWPHWPTLWRVCARGHYATHKKPLREKPPAEAEDERIEGPIQRSLPSFEEGGYRLELVREEGNEITPRLQFPGPLLPRYSLYGYPRIAEFRRMLKLLDLEPLMSQWQGYYFTAYAGIMENDERGVLFRSRENGVCFSFPMDGWKAMQTMFGRAWQSPEVASAWAALVDEYGEL